MCFHEIFFKFFFKIITNTELLKVNQDSLGIQATCRKNCCSKGRFGGLYPAVTCPGFQNSWQIWSGPLENNDYVVIGKFCDFCNICQNGS